MKNLKAGSITDIPIYLNVTLVLFLPVLAWLLSRPEQIAIYADLIETLAGRPIDAGALASGDTPLLLGAVGAVGLMVGVLIHELGHSWTARYFDVTITSITLWIFGGMARMEELPEDWHVEFWVALAGPVTSVLLSVGFLGALRFVPEGAPVLTFVVGWLAVVNLSLAVFNMVPAFPMDGGRVLRALLARSQPYAAATQRAAGLAKVLAVVGAVLAIVGGAPLLILISMFVFVAANAESRATVVRELLRGFTARDLMNRDVPTVDPDDSVADFLETVFRERHTAFPVVDDGSVIGVASLADAQSVAEVDRGSTRVADIVNRDAATAAPDRDAFELIGSMGDLGVDCVVVVDDGAVVGIVTTADIVAALEVIEGVGNPSRPDLRPPDGYA